jgi:hypothetical protein
LFFFQEKSRDEEICLLAPKLMQMGLTDLSILSGAASLTHARGFERAIMRDPNARAAQFTRAVE